MKMADVRVGMRLRSTLPASGPFKEITVTELTDRGFKYSIDHEAHAYWGNRYLKEGHEHFGLNGAALFKQVCPLCDGACTIWGSEHLPPIECCLCAATGLMPNGN